MFQIGVEYVSILVYFIVAVLHRKDLVWCRFIGIGRYLVMLVIGLGFGCMSSDQIDCQNNIPLLHPLSTSSFMKESGCLLRGCASMPRMA
jgi:hypothetical protein